ncbi:sigma 54-interacting transcriptional regulator [Vibrio sp. S457-15]|nr:sigma 54-interacting transcriptional regulator [Vibrio sp. S457-15]
MFVDESEIMPFSRQVKGLRQRQEHTVERVGGNRRINLDF